MENKKYGFVRNFDNGFACVKLSNKCGVVNEKGEEIIPIKYDYIGEPKYCHYYSSEIIGGEQYFKRIDIVNEPKISTVMLNGKYGVVNENGEQIIPCELNLKQLREANNKLKCREA